MLLDGIENTQLVEVRCDSTTKSSEGGRQKPLKIIILSGSLLLLALVFLSSNFTFSSARLMAGVDDDDEDMVGPTLLQHDEQKRDLQASRAASSTRDLQDLVCSSTAYPVEYGRSPGSHVGSLDGLANMDECYAQCCQNEDCEAIIFIPDIQSTTRCYLLDRSYEGNFVPHNNYRVATKVTQSSTPEPTGTPTTDVPTSLPTRSPSGIPTQTPSTVPTEPPTVSPTTSIPTEHPTTAMPTDAPAPSQSPTSKTQVESWIQDIDRWGVQCTTYTIGSLDSCYCRDNYCLNEGESLLTPTGCICFCHAGFAGVRCETPN